MSKEVKQYFIYIRSTGEKVPVTKEQHDSFYREASRIRDKEQNHGRCMCPYRFIWKCDGDCVGCEYHAAGDTLSLDVPNPDGNGSMYDYIPDESPSMEEVIADRHASGAALCSDCVNLIRRPIPSSSFGRITRRVFPTAPSPENSVARRRPSQIR
jgi:hypothetical protein